MHPLANRENMMSRRKVLNLPQSTQNGLRATTIVSSFHRIVEELVWNSIDAKATTIEIVVDLHDFSLSVRDDGLGLLLNEDIGRWNYSSKNMSDHTSNFGFRGEALAAMCCVADVEIVSREKGTKRTFSRKLSRDGTLSPLIEVANFTIIGSSGTIVTVKNIFDRLPVRRKILKPQAELAQIKQFVQQHAILHHSTEFSLMDQSTQKNILQLPAKSSVCARFAWLHGQEMVSKMKQTSSCYGEFIIHGLISPPLSTMCHWNKDFQFIFVNNRFLKFAKSSVFQLIELCYTTSFNSQGATGPRPIHHDPTGTKASIHPCFVLQLTCPAESYDITSEMDKSEPIFRNGQGLKKCLSLLLQKIFTEYRDESLKIVKELCGERLEATQLQAMSSHGRVFDSNSNAKGFRDGRNAMDTSASDLVVVSPPERLFPSFEVPILPLYSIASSTSIMATKECAEESASKDSQFLAPRPSTLSSNNGNYPQPQHLPSDSLSLSSTIDSGFNGVKISPQSKSFSEAFLDSPDKAVPSNFHSSSSSSSTSSLSSKSKSKATTTFTNLTKYQRENEVHHSLLPWSSLQEPFEKETHEQDEIHAETRSDYNDSKISKSHHAQNTDYYQGKDMSNLSESEFGVSVRRVSATLESIFDESLGDADHLLDARASNCTQPIFALNEQTHGVDVGTSNHMLTQKDCFESGEGKGATKELEECGGGVEEDEEEGEGEEKEDEEEDGRISKGVKNNCDPFNLMKFSSDDNVSISWSEKGVYQHQANVFESHALPIISPSMESTPRITTKTVWSHGGFGNEPCVTSIGYQHHSIQKMSKRVGGADGNDGITPRFEEEGVKSKSSLEVSSTSGTLSSPSFLFSKLQRLSTTSAFTLNKEMLSNMTVVGQLHSSYIIVSTGKLLLAVDQHAAHERILLEELWKEKENSCDQMASARVHVLLHVERKGLDVLLGFKNVFETWHFVYEILSNDVDASCESAKVVDPDKSIGRTSTEIKECEVHSHAMEEGRVGSGAKRICKNVERYGFDIKEQVEFHGNVDYDDNDDEFEIAAIDIDDESDDEYMDINVTQSSSSSGNEARRRKRRRQRELINSQQSNAILRTCTTPNVRLVQVPRVQGELLTPEDFKEFIQTVANSPASSHSLLKPPAVSRILANKACKSSIKFGDTLSKDRCEDIINRLGQCSLPFQCAHGRPSLVPLFDLMKAK